MTTRQRPSQLVLIFYELNLVEHLVHLLFYRALVHPLEVCVQLQMLSHAEVVKENIVLRTDAKVFTQLFLVGEDVYPIELSLACCWVQKPRKRRDCGSLACSIVTQQGKDLTRIDRHRGSFHSDLAIVKLFAQVSYFKRVGISFYLLRNILKVAFANTL